MQHVLHTLSTENPSISKAFFRQDNAGCYHSSATLLACPSIEGHIRMYINEGHDVTNAEQMKAALLSYGGVEGVRV